jgi:hypothetical protein
MKTKLMIAACLSCLLSVGLGGAAAAQPGPPPPEPPPPPGVMSKIAKMVGLSDGQVSRIKAISFKAGREAIALKAKLQLAQLGLQEAMTADKTPSERQVTGMVAKIGRLETELKKIHVLRILRIRKTMSLKQWRKMEAIHAEHKLRQRRQRPGR